VSEPISIDVQGSDSDSTIERPRTPRTFSRVSSFNKSFRAESGDNDKNESPFFNQFTTVSKGYGKSLVPPTSPAKIRTPRPVNLNTPSPILGLEQPEMHLPIQAPSSPTTTRPETRSRAPITSVGSKDTNPRGMAGVDGTGIGNDGTGMPLLSGNPGPSRGSSLRSSKRLREDREGDSNINEQPGSCDTPTKRKKA
jgi:hypothetical protein